MRSLLKVLETAGTDKWIRIKESDTWFSAKVK